MVQTEPEDPSCLLNCIRMAGHLSEAGCSAEFGSETECSIAVAASADADAIGDYLHCDTATDACASAETGNWSSEHVTRHAEEHATSFEASIG